jgi:hypothetical protein
MREVFVGQVTLRKREDLDTQPGHNAEVVLVLRSDDDAEAEVYSCRRDSEIVSGNQTALAAQRGEELGPFLGNRQPEFDHRNSCQEGLDLRATGRRPGRALGEVYSCQQFPTHDGRKGGGLRA